MNLTILILTALAAVAVLAAVALVVMGKGGQLARFEADHAPLDLPADRPITAADVAGVRLPLSMWGYHVRAVDEALRRLSGALRDRDARIEELEWRLGGRGADPAAPGLPPGQHPLPFEEAEPDRDGSRAAAEGPHGRHAAAPHDRPAEGPDGADTATGAPAADGPGAADGAPASGGSSLHPSNGRA